MPDRIAFLATFPPIQTAIKISGNGDGMRIQLDIPESEMGNAVELLGLRDVVLKVQIEPEPKADDQKEHRNNRKMHI
jgi:hypothetical protein